MLKQLLVILILFFTFGNVFSANVNVNVDIYSDYSIFNYEFSFDETESYRSFSFEKPKDASVDSISSKNSEENVKYSVAGDYFIVNPKSVKNDTFTITFTSTKSSLNIYEKNSFELYSNFNFLVDELKFNVNLVENVGDIESFFPRDYRVLDDGSFQWILNNIDREELFRLEFSTVHSKEDIKNNKFWTDNLLIIVSGVTLLSALVILVLMFLFSSKFRLFNIKISLNNKKSKGSKSNDSSKKLVDSKKSDTSGKKVSVVPVVSVESTEELVKNSDKSSTSDESFESSNDKVSSDDIEILTEAGHDDKFESKIDEGEFREVMARFLTDNEKLVVSCIRENEGISQYDILNFLPKLTKSNLSKIISKLDNKKILKRIRVGKVNKIYLGSRFEVKSEESKE
jgi:hypothetical protein